MKEKPEKIKIITRIKWKDIKELDLYLNFRL